MNKKILLGLIPLLLISLSACGGKKAAPAPSEDTPSGEDIPVDNRITIDFDLNGGTSSSYQGPVKVEEFDSSVFFFDVVKEDWNFRGWEYNGVKIFDEKGHQLANPEIASSMTFKAIFSQTVKLSITKNISAAGTLEGEGEYPYNTNVDIAAYVNDGYKFEGWYAGGSLISTSVNYNFKMWSVDVTIEARFVCLRHELVVKSNNVSKGTVMIQGESHVSYVEQDVESVGFLDQVTIVANTLKDTRFLGWFDEEGELVDTNAVYTFIMPDKDVTYTAKWNYFEVEYVLNEGDNDERNVDHYTIDKNAFKVYRPSKTNYLFGGWKIVIDDVTVIDNTGDIDLNLTTSLMEDMKLIANWVDKYENLYLSTNDDSRGSVQLVSGSGDPSATAKVRAHAYSGYVFKGWFNRLTEKVISDQIEINYNMPASGNVYLEAQYMSLEELGMKPAKKGKTITYGLYPKNRVTDSEILDAFENGAAYHDVASYYYWNLQMFCFEGGILYECEPIVWECVDALNRIYISKYILNASSYYSLEVLHPTRYASSTLRTMINNEIGDLAFAYDDSYTEMADVSNSGSTTDSEDNQYSPKADEYGYVSPSQKAFALSYQDMVNFFSTNVNATKTRRAFLTEYAIDRGITINSYWTRSPVSYAETESEVWSIDSTGALVEANIETKLGNRPAIKFTSAIDTL